MRRRFIFALSTVVVLGMVSGACTPPEPDARLYDAIRTGQVQRVRAYLADGGDPNGVIEDSPLGAATPLKVAVYGQREDIAVALLNAGARMDLAGIELSDVSAAGMSEALSVLLARKGMPASLDETKRAIDASVSFGYYDATAVLLGHLARLDAVSQDALWDAMNLAIGRGYDDIARLLLENGGPASAAALQAAGLRSSPGMVHHLLSLGADPLEPYRDPLAHIRPEGRNGYTSIDFAWEAYQKGAPFERQIARFKMHELLVAGASSNRFDATSLAIDGRSQLSRITDSAEELRRAAHWGYYDIVRTILSERSVRDPMVLTESTVLAIDARWDDIARLLLEAGAPPQGGALHMAVRRSSPGLVRYLLELGADPNEKVAGYTAAEYWWKEDPGAPESGPRGGGNTQVLYELIAHGAQVCWLGAHREELAQYSLSLSTLLNTASECWPEEQ